MIPLGCLCIISSPLCKAETVRMDMTVAGHAVLQPNGEYEVPEGGTVKFEAKLPKMPVRNREIWIFNYWTMSWFLNGAIDVTNKFTYNLTKDAGRGPIQMNMSSLLTYAYIHIAGKYPGYDYGASDLAVLNFK